jgi:hypothetical protein
MPDPGVANSSRREAGLNEPAGSGRAPKQPGRRCTSSSEELGLSQYGRDVGVAPLERPVTDLPETPPCR